MGLFGSSKVKIDKSPWNASQMQQLMDAAMKEFKSGPVQPYSGQRVAGQNSFLQNALHQMVNFGGNEMVQAGNNAAMGAVQGGQQVGQAAGGYGQQINNAGQNMGDYVNYVIGQGANGQSNVGNVAAGTDPTSAINRAMNPTGPNPYLDQMMQQVSGNLTRNLNENIMPRIDQGAIADNAYGGSRQGIAQGMAIRDTQQQIGDATGRMAYQDYSDGQNRALQAAGLSSQLQGQADQTRLAQQQLGLGGAQLSAGMYGDALNSMFKSGAMAPILQALQQGPIDQLLRAGQMQQGQDQAQLDAKQQYWNESQNAGWENIQRLASILNPIAGATQPAIQSAPEQSGIGKILGGISAGSGAYGALGSMGLGGIAGPAGIGLGLLSMFG